MKKLNIKTNGERYILERIEHSLICHNGYITTLYEYNSLNLKSKSFRVKNFYYENDIEQRLSICYTIEQDGKCRITLINRKIEHYGGDN